MAAPQGNEYFKLCKSPGKSKQFTPNELEEFANNYFKYIDNNPHEKKKTESDGDKIKTTIEYIKRPYTIEGLCNFIGISTQTFYNYENDKAYLDIITRARQIIYDSKLEGATAGIFNANIVIRDLGLKDSATVTHETSIKELQPSELKQLHNDISLLYGTVEPITIDITPEES